MIQQTKKQVVFYILTTKIDPHQFIKQNVKNMSNSNGVKIEPTKNSATSWSSAPKALLYILVLILLISLISSMYFSQCRELRVIEDYPNLYQENETDNHVMQQFLKERELVYRKRLDLVR